MTARSVTPRMGARDAASESAGFARQERESAEEILAAQGWSPGKRCPRPG